MNLRANKGAVGIDVAMAVIILVVMIPTMFGIVYNILKDNNLSKREATAVKVATEVIEIVKSFEYDKVTLEEDGELLEKLNEKYTSSNYTNKDYEEENYEYAHYLFVGSKGEHYQIQIGILSNKNYKNSLKKVKVTVIYSTGNKEKAVDISTNIQK